jgi:hypothetical protein
MALHICLVHYACSTLSRTEQLGWRAINKPLEEEKVDAWWVKKEQEQPCALAFLFSLHIGYWPASFVARFS